MSTNPTHETIVIATFPDTNSAEQAVEALHDVGFTSDQIRYSEQFTSENFLEGVRDLLVFPREAQDESEDDLRTMLINMGISREEIQYYSDEFNNKHAVVVVRQDDREKDAATILQQNGGQRYQG